MVGPGNSAAIGAGRMLAIQQTSDRTYRVYAGIEEPLNVVREFDFTTEDKIAKSRAALLNLYEDWAPNLRAFIQDAEGPWRVWPLYTLDADLFLHNPTEGEDEGNGEDERKEWKRAPGVTLLGDAAHVGLPNGEGVNIAMLDALKLSECLSAELGNGKEENFNAEADAAAVERAIVAYEAEMLPRAREHILDGIAMNDMMYKADGAQRMIEMFKRMMEAAGQASETA
jgi:hypothetical protein